MKKFLPIVLLALLLLPGGVHQKASLDDRTPPYEVKYHTYEELSSLVLQLNNSPYVLVKIIGHSVEGKPIYAIRISSDLNVHKPAIVRVFNQHGREYITGETAMFLAYYLDALLHGTVEDQNASDILSVFDVYIIPVANPDGHDIALMQNERQRKNAEPIDEDGDGLVDEDPPEDLNGDGYIDLYYSSARNYIGAEGNDDDNDGRSGEDRIGGVDPNRNRPRDRGELATPSDETYPGSGPLSEPETRSIYEFLKRLGPVAVFDIHSGIKALLYPPGTEYGSTTLQEIYSEMHLLAISSGREAMVSVNLYPAYGTLEDTGYFDLHAVSITLEIFGNRSRPKYEQMPNGNYRVYGVKRMFNPMPSKLLDTMREASKMILGCSHIVYKHRGDVRDFEAGYKFYNDTLYVYVDANKRNVREAFAVLIGENLTRYYQLYDQLDFSQATSVKIDDLKPGEYVLIIFVHLVLGYTFVSFNVTIPEEYYEDSDHDGLPDYRESVNNVASPEADDDHDGLKNFEEYLLGLNPRNNDSDRDGILDSIDYSYSRLSAFRGSSLSDVAYIYESCGPEVLEGKNQVFISVIGENRSIEYVGEAKVYSTNDVLFAYYESLSVVVHACGESRMFSFGSQKPVSEESKDAYRVIALAIIIAVIVLALVMVLTRRR